MPKGTFRPVPKVDSAVVRIVPHRPFLLSADAEADLRALTRAAFAMRRKQFQKILRTASGYGLSADEIAALETRFDRAFTARPEEFSPEEFVQLSRFLRDMEYPKRDAAA